MKRREGKEDAQRPLIIFLSLAHEALSLNSMLQNSQKIQSNSNIILLLKFPTQQCNCYVQGNVSCSYIFEWEIITIMLCYYYFVFAGLLHFYLTIINSNIVRNITAILTLSHSL